MSVFFLSLCLQLSDRMKFNDLPADILFPVCLFFPMLCYEFQQQQRQTVVPNPDTAGFPERVRPD